MNPHEPTPEFRAHLEWQIETALRREMRLAAPVGTRLQRLRVVLVVAAALAIGGVAGVASGHVQEARQRDRLVESARSDEALARLRLEMAQADFQDARRRVETGVAGRDTLEGAERQLRAMQTALAKIQLDIAEIQATSAAPRNDLQAPVVGQRDFVRERLALELALAQQALVAAEQSRSQAEERVKAGVAARIAQLQAETELAQARAQMRQLQAMLEMRLRSLRGEIKAEDLAPAVRRMELTLLLERAQRELELARLRVEFVRRQLATGMATELELKRAEVDLLEREVEVKGIQQELDALKAVRR